MLHVGTVGSISILQYSVPVFQVLEYSGVMMQLYCNMAIPGTRVRHKIPVGTGTCVLEYYYVLEYYCNITYSQYYVLEYGILYIEYHLLEYTCTRVPVCTRVLLEFRYTCTIPIAINIPVHTCTYTCTYWSIGVWSSYIILLLLQYRYQY